VASQPSLHRFVIAGVTTFGESPPQLLRRLCGTWVPTDEMGIGFNLAERWQRNSAKP